jgi:helicase
MLVSELPVPDTLKLIYEAGGIRELYPPQAECVEKGLFQGRNLLISIPTASGKTLVAELAMHHHISAGGKCLYIVPLKALASEKNEEFSRKGVRVGISTGDFDRRDDFLGRNDIIVATSEKLDSLIRNGAPWLSSITLLVIDEVHLIDDHDRGATLEMVITKMRYLTPGLQLIGLSATIGNPHSLAGWLGGDAVTSEWRPVDLRQGVFYDGAIRFHQGGTRSVPTVSRYDDLNLCLDTIREGGQCLVFVSSRRNAEAFAKRAANGLKCESDALLTLAERLKGVSGTEMGRTLAACVAKGAAFHHAGLSREERKIVEEGFRSGQIRCIASTPTLAAGLNLPARRVIIRDYLRFYAGEGMVPIPVREYHQMAGRAGRPRLDPYGEAVLIAKDGESVDALFEWYIDAAAEEVHSRCSGETVLCSHILSLIASQFATSRDQISEFMERTFFLYQRKKSVTLPGTLDRVLSFLEGAEMITRDGDHLSATEYGSLVSRLYLQPQSAEMIVNGIRKAEKYTDTALLQLLCMTPDMFTLYVSNKDLFYLDKFLALHEGELWFGEEPEGSEAFYRSVKTAMVLSDWSLELSDEILSERYGVGPGDIYGLVESVSWLIHAAVRLTGMFSPRFSGNLRELEYCMKYGVKRELLPLVRIRNIGRVRARRLFNNGIHDETTLRKAGRENVAAILGSGITDLIFRDLERHSDTVTNGRHGPDQRTLGEFRDEQ